VLFCDFLTRWPSLPVVRQATRKTLETFFHAHNCRRAKLIEGRLESIRCAVALTDDPGIVAPHRLLALMLVAQPRTALAAIDVFDKEIATVARTLPDFDLFDRLPGAGPHLTPRLLAAFGEQRDRFKGADELQKYSGIAPVTERSGKKSWVHWRWQCPTFLRQSFVEWAGQTINKSFWAGAYCRQQRAKGGSSAVRELAFNWIRILYRCWQAGTRYDESIYLNALRKRGSSLLKNLALPG
jgi:transposase